MVFHSAAISCRGWPIGVRLIGGGQGMIDNRHRSTIGFDTRYLIHYAYCCEPTPCHIVQVPAYTPMNKIYWVTYPASDQRTVRTKGIQPVTPRRTADPITMVHIYMDLQDPHMFLYFFQKSFPDRAQAPFLKENNARI